MDLQTFCPKEKIVSLDIFDTLVKRLVYEPRQVFSLMVKSALNRGIVLPENFVKLRVEAERCANRESGYANIYEIYNKIEHLNKETRDAALKLEVETEVELCIPNPEIVALYKRCIHKKKRVIILSDMYLPKKILKRILNNCGITCYEKIYVSCEYKAGKQNGSIYGIVLKELGVKPQEVFHIGDNLKSDFLIPHKLGIHSLHYRENSKPTRLYREKKETAGIRNLNVFNINMQTWKYPERQKNIPFQIGYSGLGPLLFGFSKWLDDCFIRDGIEKVFFLSRDGLIMQKAYQVLGGKKKNTYLYASRKALIVPSLIDHMNVEDVFSRFFTSNRDTIGSLIEKLGFEAGEYADTLARYGLNVDDRIDVEKLDDSPFLGFYQEIQPKIVHNSKEQAEFLRQYLEEIGFFGKVAIVDIGWHGNMQRALVEIIQKYDLKVKIKGYYIGVIPNSNAIVEDKLDVCGYLFEEGRDDLFRYVKHICGLVEYLFSATHGTVIGYQKDGSGKIQPKFGTYEYAEEMMNMDAPLPAICNEKKSLEIIQDAAIRFIKDINQHPCFADQEFRPEDCYKKVLTLGIKPARAELVYIGNLRYYGSDRRMYYIARPQTMFYYILNPQKLCAEFFIGCGWRIGFLKRLIKLPLPYAKLYFWMRKMGGKNY